MRISVTTEHIARGRRCLNWACAVALAIAEALPGSDPWVGPFDILVRHRGRVRTVETPKHVAAFIVAFDAGRAIEPIEFELPLGTAA